MAQKQSTDGFGPHASSPREAAAPAPRRDSSPWRQSFYDSSCACVPATLKRGRLHAQMDAIEGIAAPNGAAVVSLLEKTFTEKVSPLGEDAACAFIGAVLVASLRAAAQGKSSEDTAGQICGAAEKLGRIAERLKDGKAFTAVCSATGTMPDFALVSKYMNYMLAASQVLGNAGKVAVQAAFIAERARGMVPDRINGLLTDMLGRLNDIVAEAGQAKAGAKPGTP